MPFRLKSMLRRLGWLDYACFVFLVAALAAGYARPASDTGLLLTLVASLLTLLVAIKWLVRLVKAAIWRLRYRLMVAYLFIAVVPVVLLALLAWSGARLFAGQVAAYFVTNELERQTSDLLDLSRGLAWTQPSARTGRAQWLASSLLRRFPDLEVLVRDGANLWQYPEQTKLVAPPPGWGEASGLVRKGGSLYFWAHAVHDPAEVVMLVPVTRRALDQMIPVSGDLALLRPDATSEALPAGGAPVVSRIPPPENVFDSDITHPTVVPIAVWESPGRYDNDKLFLSTRMSAVLRTVVPQKLEWRRGMTIATALWTASVAVAVAFLIVELVSVVIGIRLTRTITRAVHNLYRGTLRVREGDFSHRIEVHGKDQLAELSDSFNSMTENVQRLLHVAKEKERLQSELEIAREVQNQLFPRSVPVSRTLELAATCRPARLVSGDYYDYVGLQDSRLALAIGDVAGKGISAALLMATVQATMRTQLCAGSELILAAGSTMRAAPPSTAALVGRLNQQLFAFTPPEKFATFLMAVYDEDTGLLTYTNAGHLPPILVREGTACRLEVTGTVVGAFSFVEYGESAAQLRSGDLLVCFTDGVTEPENEFGEMFGESRLTELVIKNAARDSGDIIQAVLESVEQWTGSPELQDDMTLLLARRV